MTVVFGVLFLPLVSIIIIMVGHFSNSSKVEYRQRVEYKHTAKDFRRKIPAGKCDE